MENNQTLSRTVPAGNIKPPLELHIFVQASVYDEESVYYRQIQSEGRM